MGMWVWPCVVKGEGKVHIHLISEGVSGLYMSTPLPTRKCSSCFGMLWIPLIQIALP